MQEIKRDRTVAKMVISKRLALKLVGGNPDKWIKVNQREITDDEGTTHVCGHALTVSWRWALHDSTRDNTVYISSKLHAQKSEQGNTAPKGMFDLLVPERYDSTDLRSSRPGFKPVYHLSTKTQGMCPFVPPPHLWRLTTEMTRT